MDGCKNGRTLCAGRNNSLLNTVQCFVVERVGGTHGQHILNETGHQNGARHSATLQFHTIISRTIILCAFPRRIAASKINYLLSELKLLNTVLILILKMKFFVI